MKDIPNYPENRLDIRVDERGNVVYEQNPVFAKYYAKTPLEEKEEELETLKHRLEMLKIDEPTDVLSVAYEDWEDLRDALEEQIDELEEEIENMQ
jgi:hypothetical protein